MHSFGQIRCSRRIPFAWQGLDALSAFVVLRVRRLLIPRKKEPPLWPIVLPDLGVNLVLQIAEFRNFRTDEPFESVDKLRDGVPLLGLLENTN